MEPFQPEVMVRQVEALSTDLRTRTDLFTNRVSRLLSPAEWESIDTVILTGSGDSHTPPAPRRWPSRPSPRSPVSR
ncbi:hypothetical protein [Streptomyces sp. NPDC059455]|uniref:hypothetical protein n=1 Tax=Streptomyces sp. NPDC059455 TaxID=3346837 RepID=UPI0036A57B9A